MFSVLILTLNEEKNLPDCIASATGCEDIVVLDSGSTDRTCELALSLGARVHRRPFDHFAGQRNHAQHNIFFRNPWVFHLDADERLTPALLEECRRVATENPAVDGCFVAPRMLWCGQWLPRCTDFPAYQARFVRAPTFEFIQAGHGQREAPGMRMGRLSANYLHEMCPAGEAEWLAKHRRYARQEACLAIAQEGRAERPSWKDLFHRDPLLRRRALKSLSHTLPLRPAARFVYQYLLRGGFLDGKPGLHYCKLLARYEGFITEEKRRLGSGLTVAR